MKILSCINVLQADYSHVRPIVSKLSNDKIQVVLQDNVHGEEAIDMAYSFATKVESGKFRARAVDSEGYVQCLLN